MKTAGIFPPEPTCMAYPWALVTFGGGTQLAWLVDHKTDRDGNPVWIARKWNDAGRRWTKARIRVMAHEIVRDWRHRPAPLAIKRARAAHQKRLAKQSGSQ